MNPIPPSIPSTLRTRDLRLVLAFGLLLLAPACATNGTLLVTRPSPPIARHIAPATGAPVEARLVSVIRPAGRGSWKREAAWDEFTVRLVNPSSVPLQIEAANLLDFSGASLDSGRDPWDLEKQSRNWWQNTRSSTASQAAAYALGAFALGPGMLVGPVLAAPAYAAGFVGIHRSKARITAEFQRRRLTLPLTLAPGATVTGSLFFPVAPRPHALVLRGNDADDSFELRFDLAEVIGPAPSDPQINAAP